MPLKAYADVSGDAKGLIFDLNLNFIHILCMQAVKVETNLRICVDSPQLLLLTDAISIEISHCPIYAKLSDPKIGIYNCVSSFRLSKQPKLSMKLKTTNSHPRRLVIFKSDQ